MKRVVITGIGFVSAAGTNYEEFKENLKANKSFIKKVERFDVSDFPVQIAGEITDFSYEGYIDKKAGRRMDRFIQYGIVASKKAVEDSGLEIEKEDPYRIGIILSSGIGGLDTLTKTVRAVDKNPKKVSPFAIPMILPNMAAGFTSIELGIKGPSWAVISACATGNHSIISAYDQIVEGKADVMLAGGSEAPITEVGIGGFAAMKALSTRNDAPEKASRPFDNDRDGFVMGEGGAVVILEEYERAKKRGAKIYGEIKGYGMATDAYHMAAPDPEGKGAKYSINSAIKMSGLSLDKIKYANAHGTSTPAGDGIEFRAIESVFKNESKIYLNSTKSITGHLLGAAGNIEMIACLIQMNEGFIHPNVNLENTDLKSDWVILPRDVVDFKFDNFITNSFGFGGHDATILVGKV
jgi:3-oxoacyl-[acyl-carrier-protein] synthase II